MKSYDKKKKALADKSSAGKFFDSLDKSLGRGHFLTNKAREKIKAK